MPRWTFGKKLGLGFAAVVLLGLLIGAVAIYALKSVSGAWDRVLSLYATNVTDARSLEVSSLRRTAANRAFLVSKDEQFITQAREERDRSDKILGEIQSHVDAAGTAQERDLLAKIKAASKAQADAADKVLAARRTATDVTAVSQQFQEQVVPENAKFQAFVEEFVRSQEKRLDDMGDGAAHAASVAIWLLIGIACAGVIMAAVIAYLLGRTLSRQIGSAVQHIQSSSAQLQSAANQQTAGSKEQVASMNEISTTIRELLSTAKQIADSAQRVAHIADETAAAAHAGDGTVQKAQNDVAGIRQQVDQIVNHMLDLGRKSQQIGGILEIINELAEQTNILAINATIEAAGAGETGRRFSVVADEIRKLADRVGGSTREIRTLIDEIRSAVNTTVMATEGGSKAVDLGVRQFSEVAGAFRRIVDLLGTTTEAAREIELSTKQQSTAVEQVNLAVTNVAQAARESEASSSQVLQTVGELTTLSRDLARLVQSSSLDGRADGRAATVAAR